MKELEKKNSEVEERLSTLQNENQMLRHVIYTYISLSFTITITIFDLIWFDLIWLNVCYADLEEHNGWYARKEIEVDLIRTDQWSYVARKLKLKAKTR